MGQQLNWLDEDSGAQSWLFEKINEIIIALTKVTSAGNCKTYINEIMYDKWIFTCTNELRKILGIVWRPIFLFLKKKVISLYMYLFKTQTFKIQKSKKVSQKPNYYNRYIKMTNITSLQNNVNQNYKEISFMAGILSQRTMSAENMWRKYNA